MINFCQRFFPQGFDKGTFFESCGVADLVATCAGGRNARCARAYAEANGTKTLEELEQELLNGQKLQGPATANEVNVLLRQNDCVNE